MLIFVGWDSKMQDVAETLAFSIRKHSTMPYNIRYLKLPELNFHRDDKTGNTEFTYTRFLIPHLCNYKGTALFIDNDMLCLSDIQEIAELDMSKYAIRCKKHNQIVTLPTKMDGKPQEAYPRKNWSSFMLMDCSKLKCWTKEAVETQSSSWLHRFEPIPDDLIGDIPEGWNDLDYLKDNTKLIHYTSGGIWNNGREFNDIDAGYLWLKTYYEYKNKLQ